MDGGRKSDRLVVPGKPSNKAVDASVAAEEVEEGAWPRGICESKPGTGHRVGSACNKRSSGYGRQRREAVSSSPRFSTTCTTWTDFGRPTTV